MTVLGLDLLFLVAASCFSAYLIIRLGSLGLLFGIPAFWLFVFVQFFVRENYNNEPLVGLPIGAFFASGIAAGVVWCLAFYGALVVKRFITSKRNTKRETEV